MTSKEALERLYLGIYSTNEMANYYDLVLKALERLEMLEKENEDLKEMLSVANYVGCGAEEKVWDLMQENEKLKQSLEILKQQIRIIESYASMFREKGSEKTYRVDLIIGSPYITQLEYELLNEVLNNENNSE